MNLKSTLSAIGVSAALLLFPGCGQNKDEKPKTDGEGPVTEVAIEEPPLSPCMLIGKEVYSQHCLVCHQVGGGGVSGLNPPLKETEYVLGRPENLIAILIKGSNEGLEVNGTTYSNAMPGFSYLTDEEIACVATYIRNSFGNKAPAVSTSEVTRLRPQ